MFDPLLRDNDKDTAAQADDKATEVRARGKDKEEDGLDEGIVREPVNTSRNSRN